MFEFILPKRLFPHNVRPLLGQSDGISRSYGTLSLFWLKILYSFLTMENHNCITLFITDGIVSKALLKLRSKQKKKLIPWGCLVKCASAKIQWNLGISDTRKGLRKTVLNSEVVLFPRSISMYWIGLGTKLSVLNSHIVPISQVVLKTSSTVLIKSCVFFLEKICNYK